MTLLSYLNKKAENFKDILYIDYGEHEFATISIFCKPNYNVDLVLSFIEKYKPLGIAWKVYVVNENDLVI